MRIGLGGRCGRKEMGEMRGKGDGTVREKDGGHTIFLCGLTKRCVFA